MFWFVVLSFLRRGRFYKTFCGERRTVGSPPPRFVSFKIFYKMVGRIVSVADQIVIIRGLADVFLGEMVYFGSSTDANLVGQAVNLERDGSVKAVLLRGVEAKLYPDMKVYRSHEQPKVKCGTGVLGQVVDPLGQCINVEDFNPYVFLRNELLNTTSSAVEAEVPGIIDREPVRTPVLTGIHVVDTLIPIGCGQRELIIGDRGTGKTSLALTIILNQHRYNVRYASHWRHLESLMSTYVHGSLRPCIYVAVGQRRSEIFKIKELLAIRGAMVYTCIVFTAADENPGLQFAAPYAGTTVGEWFRDEGYRSIVIYDDLSNHAVAYRQSSLLLRRPPGREAFPGDIFYTHSRLLERSAQLAKNRGGGALTSFPIIETRGGDVSAYIPTNVISITDGQIYLSKELAVRGQFPAVNTGLSVSRVGSAAQTASTRELSKQVRGDFVAYRNYESLERFGESAMDATVKQYITRGRRIRAYFRQNLFETSSSYEQLIGMFSLNKGYMDRVAVESVTSFVPMFFNPVVASRYLTTSDQIMKYAFLITDASPMDVFLYSHDFSLVGALVDDVLELYTPFFIATFSSKNRSMVNDLFSSVDGGPDSSATIPYKSKVHPLSNFVV